MVPALLGVLFLLPATIAALYYVVLTTVGWRTRPADPSLTGPRTRFAIVIPAHDEEAVLGATLTSILASRYPRSLVESIVIADNCSDDTAEVARRHGIACLIRNHETDRGKGYALAAGIPRALTNQPDAVLILDADCRLHPNCLSELDRELSRGSPVVQAAVRMGDPEAGPTGLVMAVGSELENGVQAGLSRIGGTVRLRGTGMAFRREVLEQHPWRSFGVTEDAEYSSILRRAGIRITFVPTATLQNSPPTNTADLCQQRRRWRDALFTESTGWFDRWLASKPLVLGQLVLTLAAVGVFSLASPGPIAAGFALWAGWLLLLTATLYLHAAGRVGASTRTLLSLWRAPMIVTRLAWVTLGGILHRGGAWNRTPRLAEV